MSGATGEHVELSRRVRCERAAAALFVLWPLVVAVLWTTYALAPIGVVASANVGTLVSIHGSTVISTRGYFNVSDAPSAEIGTPLRVIRTNSPRPNAGLQLCASRNTSDMGWCSGIEDGYAGVLSKTPLAHRLRSRAALSALLTAALLVTMLGWMPGFAMIVVGDAAGGKVDRPTAEA